MSSVAMIKGSRAALILGLVLLGSGCSSPGKPTPPPEPRFITQIDWAEKGTWLKSDTHVHTTFSDGSYPVEEVAHKAIAYGCDVIAITDHGDKNLKAATREYHEAIESARRAHPKLIVLAGLEWNLPPGGGDEHATVLIPPDLDEWRTLAAFKAGFDDHGRNEHQAELALEGLRWLEANATANGVKPVVIYNHPSRHDDGSRRLTTEFLGWRKVNDLMIGFEGAPGHQGKSSAVGSYKSRVKPIDRWDPVVADVGGVWDRLLRQGLDVWAARADSDFHNDHPGDLNDYWPGQFSETWLYAPERSGNAALRALRAGSFFAAHGHIVRAVELSIEADGLPRRAYPGETIALPAGQTVVARLKCVIPAKDWSGQPNRIDEVELIAVKRTSTEVIATRPLPSDGVVRFDPIEVPPGGIVLRARGRRILPARPHLLFYTNPVRVQADG